jgi:hypothetical protein
MKRRWFLLAIAVWVGFGLVCLLGGKADADEPPNPNRLIITCADVREIVRLLGEQKAEEAARAAGATEAQIARAKKCLR